MKRSKELPEGGSLDLETLQQLGERLAGALAFGRAQGNLCRDPEARAVWREVYGPLSEGKPGLTGCLLARAEAHVMRFASLYAVIDGSAAVKVKHLEAALALWDYCEQSVRHIFGDSTGDPVADEILRSLRNSPAGLTRTEISNLFGRNQSAGRIDKALALLLENGLATMHRDKGTGGGPAERWEATKRTKGTK